MRVSSKGLEGEGRERSGYLFPCSLPVGCSWLPYISTKMVLSTAQAQHCFLPLPPGDGVMMPSPHYSQPWVLSLVSSSHCAHIFANSPFIKFFSITQVERSICFLLGPQMMLEKAAEQRLEAGYVD